MLIWSVQAGDTPDGLATVSDVLAPLLHQLLIRSIVHSMLEHHLVLITPHSIVTSLVHQIQKL